MIGDNTRGALFMTGSMVSFTVNDAFMKSLKGVLPLNQAIFLRGLGVVLALTLLAAALGQLRQTMDAADRKLVAVRALAEVGAAWFFLTALFNMPLANVTAIIAALPLTVTLAAALVYREPVGWRRITAILVGAVGVLLIVRPGATDFNIYALSALAAVASVTVRDLAARRMSRQTGSVKVALLTAVAVTAAFGAFTATAAWVPVSGQAFGMVFGAMIFVIGGYVFSVTAMRVGEIGFVAPFRYTALLAAIILGYMVFGDWPRPLTFLGAGIVVATGVYTVLRERKVSADRVLRSPRQGPI